MIIIVSSRVSSPQAKSKIFSFSPKTFLPSHFIKWRQFFPDCRQVGAWKMWIKYGWVFFSTFFLIFYTFWSSSRPGQEKVLYFMIQIFQIYYFFFQNYVNWTRKTRKICQTNTTYVYKKILEQKVPPVRQNQKFLFPPQNLLLPRHFKKWVPPRQILWQNPDFSPKFWGEMTLWLCIVP